MQLNLDRLLWGIRGISFTPIIANRVCKDISILAEGSSRDGSAHLRIALETVFCVLVPEVKGAV